MDEKKITGVLGTEGFASVYSNHVSASMSAVDIRLFMSEVSPKELNLEHQDNLKAAEPLVNPRVCLVMTPEFAKILLDTLSTLVPQYQDRFGKLRPNPEANK